jgi:hypothetical protein
MNKRKSKGESWDPILVDRPRRKQNSGGTMLEKAMELKMRRNEPLKGNSFVVLQNDSLNQIALDVNVVIGTDELDKDRIIDKLVGEEKLNCEMFVENNPEVGIPANLDVEPVT